MRRAQAQLLVTLAALLLAGCSPVALRMPPRSAIPADTPSEVRRHIGRLYSWDVYARSISAHKLGDMDGREAAIPFLIALLPDDTVAWYPSVFIPYSGIRVGVTAMETLEAIGDPAIDPLLAAMATDPSAAARGRAARSLGCIERGRAAAARSAEALLRAAVDAPSELLRKDAAWALGRIGDPRAVDVLVVAFHEEAVPDVRAAQCEALGVLADPRALPLLVSAVQNDAAPKVRWCAATALGGFSSPDAATALIAATRDPDRSVVTNAMYSLAEMDDPRITTAMVALLRDDLSESYVFYLARTVLRQTKNPDLTDQLIDLLASDHAVVRRRAIDLLADRIGTEHSEVYRGIRGPADTYKTNPRVAPALFAALKDPDRDVRAEAIDAIGYLDDPRSVAALIGALDDLDKKVRATAETVLAGLRPPPIAALIAATASDRKRVRTSAANLLNRLTGQNFGTDTAKWRAWRRDNPPRS